MKWSTQIVKKKRIIKLAIKLRIMAGDIKTLVEVHSETVTLSLQA